MIVLLVALGLVVGTGAVAISALWPLVTSLTASNDLSLIHISEPTRPY